MRRRGRGAALLLALAALGARAAPDVVFHAPEVLVRHAAAPRAVGTGSAAPRDAEHERLEYFVEHAVSTADARQAAAALKLSDVAASPAGCGACSRRELQYCETRALADHCCCERRFLREPFPWLPHTCYIGPERCAPLAGNCAQYARLRDCCCLRRLADHWKGILSLSPRLSAGGAALLALAAALVAAHL